MSEAVFYPSLSTLISLDDIPLLNNLSETVLEEIFYKDYTAFISESGDYKSHQLTLIMCSTAKVGKYVFMFQCE